MQKLPNEEMAAAWNGPSGQAWVEEQQLLDEMFLPIEQRLAGEAMSRGARRVLDVGCGSGATTLAVAQALGAGGQATGIDISAPLIEMARERARRQGVAATFICADAQTHAFDEASFDLLISRFGVMFFDDPVAAFTRLRRATSNDGALCLVAFRPIAENPFMTTAERAAAPLLPNLPPRRPDGPGQFAFADRDSVHAILNHSGWSGIDIRPIDVDCSLGEQDLSRYVTKLGPVGLLLQDADEATRARVAESIRGAYDPYVHGDQVRFTAACWMISASLLASRVSSG